MEHLMHVGNPHHFTYIVSSNSQNITAAMCVYPHFIKGVKQDSVSPPVSGSQHLNPGMLDFRATFTFIQQLLIDFPFYVRHCLHHICLFNLLFNLIYLFGAFKKIDSPLENKASCRIPWEFRRKQYSESLEVSCLKEGERGKRLKCSLENTHLWLHLMYFGHLELPLGLLNVYINTLLRLHRMLVTLIGFTEVNWGKREGWVRGRFSL